MIRMTDPFYFLVIADTHTASIEQLPGRITQLAKEVDCVVHCGDFTEMRVVQELRGLAKQFIGVYGNTDSPGVKDSLPYEAFFEIQGKKIAITHPFFGGPPWGLEDELSGKYPDADVILFGHTHDALVVQKNGTLLLNPGQGYPIFIQPATVGILKVIGGRVEGRIFSVDNAVLF